MCPYTHVASFVLVGLMRDSSIATAEDVDVLNAYKHAWHATCRALTAAVIYVIYVEIVEKIDV